MLNTLVSRNKEAPIDFSSQAIFQTCLMTDAKFPRSFKKQSINWLKGGEKKMEMLKRLVKEEEGQGLVEYTLIVLLVALVFWVAIRDTNIGAELTNAWGQVIACLQTPLTCT